MKIDKQQGNRSKRPNCCMLSCGCLALIPIVIILMGAGVAFLFFNSPSTVLQFVGLQTVGDVDTVFEAAAETVPEITNAQTVDSAFFSTNNFSQTVQGSGTGYSVILGNTTTDNTQQMQITFSEDELLEQCRTLTPVCGSTGTVVRNASFDLRPNGLIINGSFEIQNGIRQDAGLVMRVTPQNDLEIVGVQIGNTVYSANNSILGDIVTEIENEVNQILSQISVQAAGTTYTISDIIINDTNLTLLMQ